MAKKNPAKKTRTINQRFTALERLVRTGFQQTGARFRQIDKRFGQVDRRLGLVQLDIRNLRKEMNERFAVMEDRIDRLATHNQASKKCSRQGGQAGLIVISGIGRRPM